MKNVRRVLSQLKRMTPTEMLSKFSDEDQMFIRMQSLGPDSPFNFTRILTDDITSFDDSSFLSNGVTYPMQEAKYYLAAMEYGWELFDGLEKGRVKASLSLDWFSLVPDSWFEELKHNDEGQAKIFVESLRPFVGMVPQKLAILVVGSSSPGVAGMSYPLVASILSGEGFTGEFHLYDPFELDGVETIGGFQLHHRHGLYPGGGKYDVVLDDAYDRGKTKILYNSPVVSYKCHPVVGDVYPDGSSVETQAYYFGHEQRVLVGAQSLVPAPMITGCDDCRSCRRVRSVLYGLLRSVGRMENCYANIVRLGVTPCSSFPGTKLIACQGEILRRLNTGAIVQESDSFHQHSRKDVSSALQSLINIGVVTREQAIIRRPFVVTNHSYDVVARQLMLSYREMSCSFYGPGFSACNMENGCRPADAEVLFVSTQIELSAICPKKLVVIDREILVGKMYRRDKSFFLQGLNVTEYSLLKRKYG
jgi:hypothetical protein